MCSTFFQIHQIAYKLESWTKLRPSHATDLALKALEIMDKYSALHPNYSKIQAILTHCSHPKAEDYGPEWAADIKCEKLLESGFNPQEFDLRQDLLSEFFALFRRLFIQADFHILSYEVNKMVLSSQFKYMALDHDSFIENRYFEFSFYMLANHLYGQVWFSSMASQTESASPQSQPRTLAQVKKKIDHYYSQNSYLWHTLREKPQMVMALIASEFKYYDLSRWLLAFLDFKEAKFSKFIQIFSELSEKINLLDDLGLSTQVRVMYGLALIPCKSFKDLKESYGTELVDVYCQTEALESQIYGLLCDLSLRDFATSRQFFRKSTWEFEAEVGFAFPSNEFWQDIAHIVDLKAFLLILLVTDLISSNQMFELLGYTDEETPTKVREQLCLMIFALDLGKTGVIYDLKDDVFRRIDVDEKARIRGIQTEIDELDHNARAEALARLLRLLIIHRYS